ncbi:hypothetical protein [Olleya aquimaris]|uniref:Lipoprotein n=1 Tax=Olleya aquimaris TaxID=639310 RepID=A0A327RMS0_9FLAO|nr:hypothetical protein [Olleya aquimaris]RAJ15037.1 hypothetical protein LY08_01386 [Olleya aquimaris]
MKIKLVLASLAVTAVSCTGTPEEEAAKRFCDCSEDVTEMMKQMKEDPNSTDLVAYKKAMDDLTACVDPDGEMKKKEDAMTNEEKLAHGKKMQSLVKANCPEVAKIMGME